MPIRRRLRQLAVRFYRYPVVALALVSYLTAALGVPCARPIAKDTSQPFPCQNRPCGCLNAEHCWKHCCCFSHAEKLAWAQEHHVQPPASASTATCCEAATCDSSPGHGEDCCCSACGSASEKPREPAPCCQAQAPTPDRSAGKEHAVSWVLGIMARQCQNQGTFWLTGTPALPPPALVIWTYDWTPVAWCPAVDALAQSTSISPPAPPPRG
jgi:hypothetical protein